MEKRAPKARKYHLSGVSLKLARLRRAATPVPEKRIKEIAQIVNRRIIKETSDNPVRVAWIEAGSAENMSPEMRANLEGLKELQADIRSRESANFAVRTATKETLDLLGVRQPEKRKRVVESMQKAYERLLWRTKFDEGGDDVTTGHLAAALRELGPVKAIPFIKIHDKKMNHIFKGLLRNTA